MIVRRDLGAALLELALLGIVALPGCAPFANLRPASGLAPGRDVEVGMAVATLGPRPYVEEPTEVTGQLWGTIEPLDWLSLSAVGAFDDSSAAGGVAARWNALRTYRVAAGLEAELGYAWAAASASAAARLFGESWIYAAPRFGTLGSTWNVGIPAGVSIEMYRGFSLRGELAVSWSELKYYNRRTHAAGGVAYQW